jgi:hypothetical protein
MLVGCGHDDPARPFPPSIFLDKNRRDISKSQSIWTDSKMETAGSQHPGFRALTPWITLLFTQVALTTRVVST